MLKRLQKYFNPASAELQEEVPEMTTENAQADLATDNKMVAELTAQLASVTEAMTAMQTQLTQLAALNTQAQAALEAAEADKANLAAQAEAKRLEARTSAITAAVGTSQLEALLAATDGMEDAAFDTIVGAMAKSFENEAQGTMFQEKGVAAEVAPVENDVSKRMAARMAAAIKTQAE